MFRQIVLLPTLSAKIINGVLAVLVRFICVYFHYLYSRMHSASSKTSESRETSLKMAMLSHGLHDLLCVLPGVGILMLPISISYSYFMSKKFDKKYRKTSVNKLVKESIFIG